MEKSSYTSVWSTGSVSTRVDRGGLHPRLDSLEASADLPGSLEQARAPLGGLNLPLVVSLDSIDGNSGAWRLLCHGYGCRAPFYWLPPPWEQCFCSISGEFPHSHCMPPQLLLPSTSLFLITVPRLLAGRFRHRRAYPPARGEELRGRAHGARAR